MSSFSDNVLDEIRMDYVVNDTESYLYRFFSENSSYPGLGDEEIRKKAERLMYELGCPVSSARELERAIMRLEACKQKKQHISLSGSSFDADKNKKKLRKQEEKEKKLQDIVEAKKEKKKNNKGRKSTNQSADHKNTALSLIDGWMSESGYVHHDDEEIDIDRCEKMYRLLKHNKECKRVMMPLIIDKDTGGGIYIVGNDVCPKRCEKSKIKNVYAQLAIVLPYQANFNEEFGLVQWDVGYDCVKNALKYFKEAKELCIGDIKTENPKQPKGTPEEFRKFFGSSNDLFCSEEDFDKTRKQFQLPL